MVIVASWGTAGQFSTYDYGFAYICNQWPHAPSVRDEHQDPSKDENRVMTGPASLDELRRDLASVLASEPVDLDAVATLSARMLEADPFRVRFSVDAAHLRRLGAELIGRTETALAELVKNAYDADATEVFLHFEDSDRPGGRLRIVDNGSGMTRDQLISGYMRLSTQNKVHEPISTRFGRARAGRKGIGRLAAQRLGERLTVVTQTRESTEAGRLSVQWSDFEPGRELSEVGSVLALVPKDRDHGTTLEISELNTMWSEAAVRETARQLREVVLGQPGESRRGTQFERDPGMRVYVQHGSGARTDVQSFVERDLDRLALARIEGEVDDAGHVHWTLRSSRLEIDDHYEDVFDREGKPVLAGSLRGVRFRALYFVYDRGLLPPKELTRIRDLASRSGGIRLYRNGFRVLPYGEPGDDWLELDALARQRVVLPPIANINWIGHVAIEDREGEQFQETTSREGLIQNEAVIQLRLALRNVLEAGVKRVASMRGRKQRASDKGVHVHNDLIFASAATLHQQLTQLVADFREGAPDASAERLTAVLELAERTRDVAAGGQADARRLLDEIAMLRVLASFGIVAGEFTHEARLHIQALEIAVDRLDAAQDGHELHEAALRVRPALQPLRALLRYFERAFGEQARRETEVLELRDMVRAFHETIIPDLDRRAIAFDEHFSGGSLFTVPMHESEWTAILFNLYTNSKKALNREGGARRLLVRGGRSGTEVFLDFSDTGDGVPPELREKIFEAFFTTTAGAAEDEDDIVGLGLGLAILRDIVEGYGGRVAVVEPPQGYSTTIRMWLPAAKPEEIPPDAY